MKKIEIIDYLRGFSIFTIVLMHLIQSYPIPQIIRTASSFGGAGVHVFILCSGFGLYLSHLNKPLSYINFLKRRFIKVYIPYIAIILLSACIPCYASSENKFIELLSHIFLFIMFNESLEGSLGYQMWFISTIIQFYLLWPILVKLFMGKHKWYGTASAFLISLLWGMLTVLLKTNDMRIWNSFFLQYLWEFILGMKLAEIYYNRNFPSIKIPSYRYIIPIAIIGVGLTGITGIKGGWFKIFNDVPSLMGYLSIAILAYKLLPKIFKKFIIFTNQISYEWYLVHVLIFSCCTYYLPIKSIWISAIISLTTSYITAILYSKLIKMFKTNKKVFLNLELKEKKNV